MKVRALGRVASTHALGTGHSGQQPIHYACGFTTKSLFEEECFLVRAHGKYSQGDLAELVGFRINKGGESSKVVWQLYELCG